MMVEATLCRSLHVNVGASANGRKGARKQCLEYALKHPTPTHTYIYWTKQWVGLLLQLLHSPNKKAKKTHVCKTVLIV